MPVVVRSWPEARNTTELSVMFRAFSKRSPVNRLPVGFWGSSLSISKVTVPPSAGTVPVAVCFGVSFTRPTAMSSMMVRSMAAPSQAKAREARGP